MKCTFCIAFFTAFLAGCSEEDDAQLISSAGGVAESVYLTHDQETNPVVVWTEKQNGDLTLYFSVSTDDGKSFLEKRSIALASDVATHSESMPKVAFKSDGSIIAAYERKTPTKENKYAGAIFYRMSRDGGQSWTEERTIHRDTVAGLSRSYFDIERLPDGEIGASWLDIKLNHSAGGRSVRFSKTTRAGGFAGELLIDSSACQCCRIDVYSGVTGNVFVSYRGLKKGTLGKQIRDMMISTSTDQGESFSSPVMISADNWNIDGCPHTGPSLCGTKSELFSLWYTEGSGTGVYYARRSANEKTFSRRELVSNEGRHPQLCSNGDQIAMLWEENFTTPVKNNTVIHYRIVREGADVVRETLTSERENAFAPVVISTGEGFVAAFLQEGGNGVRVYVRRL